MKRLRLLIVDDERHFADALAERLELRGFEARTAYDAAQALEVLASVEFDVVLLDLRLPDRPGADVLREMPGLGASARTVVLTGHGSDEDYQECMGLGAKDFLHKPIAIRELSEVLLRVHKEGA
jgi:DNA-binding response OmpR family regulator